MRTREQLIHLRIVHVIIMLATALFIYQFSQWDSALWVVISVLAIIGPFSPGLTVNKANQRVLGSIAGLLLSLILWWIIHYNYNLLVIIAVVLAYCAAYSLLQEYTYFIMLVSVILCLNFDNSNLFFTNEILYIVNRSLCVLTGVLTCLLYESVIFKHYYKNAVSLVEEDKLNKLINESYEKLASFQVGETSVNEINRCLAPLILNLNTLNDLKKSCLHSYSKQGETLKLISFYEEKLITIYDQIAESSFRLLSNG